MGRGTWSCDDVDSTEVELEPGSVTGCPAELLELHRKRLENAVDRVGVTVQRRRQRVQRRDGFLDGRSGGFEQVGRRVGQSREGRHRRTDGSPLVRQARDELLGVDDQRIELIVTLIHRGQHVVEVVDHRTDHPILVGDGVGEACRILDQFRDCSRLALEHLDDLVRQLVHVVGAEGLEQRTEPVEQRGEVDGRLRPLHRNGVAAAHLHSLLPLALFERDVALPHEVPKADGRGGAGGQPVPFRHRELNLCLAVVVDRDLLDLPHTHTGDADLVALVERGDVREDRVELGATAATEVGDGGGQQTGREDGDHGEHDQLDQWCGQTPHLKLTSVPLMVGAPTSVVQLGTSSGAMPPASP